MLFKVCSISILFGLIMAGCHQSSVTKSSGESDSLRFSRDTLTLNSAAEVNQQSNFDADKFVSLAESFLTNFQGRTVSLYYVADTITGVKVGRGNYYYHSLFSSESDIIKRYSFDAGKDNREFRIWFVEATYPDSALANKSFEKLRKQANGAEDEQNYIPGLTYTNDYVIRFHNKIYWLNSGCSYSFVNHHKLVGFVRQSLKVDNIQDSIWCECGEVKCN